MGVKMFLVAIHGRIVCLQYEAGDGSQGSSEVGLTEVALPTQHCSVVHSIYCSICSLSSVA